jgi:type I restriction enzyme, R subunit
MSTQSEQALENSLIKQLVEMKYESVVIADEKDLVVNLKTQLEKHNNTTFTDHEFELILNYLSHGNVFEKAKRLRDLFDLHRDDGTLFYVEFFNQKQWCQNEYQVANQVTMIGSYKNRYDVTILINGLPLVQIELKRRGLELKEAFNQTGRYHKHSYDAGYGLYQYIQLFVISNGVNTKYYANNRKLSFKFTSYWTDKENRKITDLAEFTETFLDSCHISKLIAQHMVLAENKNLLVLRPYQYYAVETIIDRVKNSNQNGYIWHTTGSGKTLTSFKASQILVDLPEVYKVIFVVDRNDLDTQTIREFNNFQKDSVDQTKSTQTLVKQFGNPDTKLIVTTIQKLNNAITNERHLLKMDEHKDKKYIFVFDECHRSQFGETHKRIVEFFTNKQMFGFTGTPIFAENANGNRTTRDLFGECLHKYVITDAINDENVLKFSVEYLGKYHQKQGLVNEPDVSVENIDTKELLESDDRLTKIVDYILANHSRKTHNEEFNAIFATPSVEVLIKYYDILQGKYIAGEQQLKIATIFTYSPNEEDKEANGMLDEDLQLESLDKVSKHSRDKLESYVQDYNKLFSTNYTTKDSLSFYNYYRDIAERVRKKEIDLLLVVNMFLTGFDSQLLNTLYVDKNLKYHGLLQAYSRTNRIINERKSQGNIVVFRNLKTATDNAITLFSNKNAKEVIFMESYEFYLGKLNEAIQALKNFVGNPQAVNELVGEEAKLTFVSLFRDVLRIRNILTTFSQFKYSDLLMNEQEFADYTSKYLDLYREVKSAHSQEKVSILDDVDFEVELLRNDIINVDYILKLLKQLVDAAEYEKDDIIKSIFNSLNSEPQLRSKKELIEQFIKGTIPNIKNSDDIEEEFEKFWGVEKEIAFEKLCEDENLVKAKMQSLVDEYLYTNRQPRGVDFGVALYEQPKIRDRKPLLERVANRFNDFVSVFFEKV